MSSLIPPSMWRRDFQDRRYLVPWELLGDFYEINYLISKADPLISEVAKAELSVRFGEFLGPPTPYTFSQLNSMAYDAVLERIDPHLPDDAEYMELYQSWLRLSSDTDDDHHEHDHFI